MTAHLLSQVSIVIPLKDDPLIFHCLNSVDEDVEVVVVLNGSTEVFAHAVAGYSRYPIQVVSLPEPGIGAAYNAGVGKAGGEFILLMDSDCVFQPGAIRALAEGIRDGNFARGRVQFSSHSRSTRMTARTREFTEDALRTRRPNAYSPPLLYRKSVAAQLGGYHFDARLAWREDRDFELRRRAAGLAVTFVAAGVVVHKPLSIRDDLASVRNYGAGQYRGETLGVLPATSGRHETAKVLQAMARIAVNTRDPLLAAYPIIRRIAFGQGYRRARRTARAAS
jgi:glycosyltransferase involved in cell wall biosynthesis